MPWNDQCYPELLCQTPEHIEDEDNSMVWTFGDKLMAVVYGPSDEHVSGEWIFNHETILKTDGSLKSVIEDLEDWMTDLATILSTGGNMKLEAVQQFLENDEAEIKFDAGGLSVRLTIGDVHIICSNPDILIDIADVAKQAELELRRVQAHAREIADDMDAEKAAENLEEIAAADELARAEG
jgi:hypothetical protein